MGVGKVEANFRAKSETSPNPNNEDSRVQKELTLSIPSPPSKSPCKTESEEEHWGCVSRGSSPLNGSDLGRTGEGAEAIGGFGGRGKTSGHVSDCIFYTRQIPKP